MTRISTQDHVAKAEAEGLTFAEYGRKYGISASSLYQARSAKRRPRKSNANGKFLQVIKPSPALCDGPTCEIILNQVALGLWNVTIRSMSTKAAVGLVAACENTVVYQQCEA